MTGYSFISKNKKMIRKIKSELGRFSRDEDGQWRYRTKNGQWKYNVDGRLAELRGTLGELTSK